MIGKMSIAVVGLLWVGAGEASSQTFEQEVLQTSQEVSDSAQQMRQNRAAPPVPQQDGIPVWWDPANAFDETWLGVAAKFISIKPGEPFEMGSPADEEGRDGDEVQHRVELTKGFEMQATEVTQLQYFLVTARNPSYFRKKENCDKGNFKSVYGQGLCVNHPVETVSWDGAQKFIEELNQIQDKCVYRLPTEAEWEYAARGGMPSGFPYSFGFNDTNELNNHAWSYRNSNDRTHARATKKANPWGLYDMYGNVGEWVQDWYSHYSTAAVTDPAGPTAGSNRVFRGGSWSNGTGYLRSAARNFDDPGDHRFDVGFRLVRSCRRESDQ